MQKAKPVQVVVVVIIITIIIILSSGRLFASGVGNKHYVVHPSQLGRNVCDLYCLVS